MALAWRFLDSVQDIGFGMMLLQFPARFHVVFLLTAAQAISSIATILAGDTAPNKIGPDISALYEGLTKAWFSVALIFQLVVCFIKFLVSIIILPSS
jgi:alpha-1,3-glucan synthase